MTNNDQAKAEEQTPSAKAAIEKEKKDAEQRKAEAIKLINQQRAEKKLEHENKTSPTKTIDKNPPRVVKKSKTAAFSLIIALLSMTAVGGLYYWQQLQNQKLAQNLNKQNQLFIVESQDQIQSLLTQQRQQLTKRVDRVISQISSTQQAKINQLENDLANISKRQPSDWLVQESQYLIRVAVRSLWLEHNADSAIGLLKDADQRLQSLNDPQYLPVRQLIHQDIEQLQLLPKLTIDETILSLMGLAQQVKQLPLLKIERIDNLAQQQAFELSENTADWRENLSRSWHKFLQDFITIRRQDGAVIPLMSPEYQQNLRENLTLKLQLAQWAASQGKTAIYQKTLADIQRWQQQYFAMDNAINVNFKQRLKHLKNAVVAIQLPKTLASLSAMQQLLKPQSFKLPVKESPANKLVKTKIVSKNAITAPANTVAEKPTKANQPTPALQQKPITVELKKTADKASEQNEAM
jgi:uroporphyrin-III C-methyltransferase